MKTDIEIRDWRQVKAYRKYEVERLSCGLEVNDTIIPGAVIGRHYKTGQEIMAPCYGQVATMYFNPMHASLMIMIIDIGSDI